MPDPITGGPPSATGFGPRESADETRQSQHAIANDAVADVNCNAILARMQASTYALMGANFEANAARFQGMMSHAAAVKANGS